jgi:hypothetical protein
MLKDKATGLQLVLLRVATDRATEVPIVVGFLFEISKLVGDLTYEFCIDV